MFSDFSDMPLVSKIHISSVIMITLYGIGFGVGVILSAAYFGVVI